MPERKRQAATRSRLRWRSGDEFELDGIEYVCRPRFDTFDSTPERFCIRKPRPEIERLEDLLGELAPRRIFEVGIHKGGSTALIAQLAEPEKLIAIDIGPLHDGAGLAAFIERHGLRERTAIHWGVDQADRERLGAICDEELDEEPLDLVIDDASHLLDPTRETFNALFPRLRPGGTYLLEDWGWAHAQMNLWPERTPLTVLVFEALMSCAHRPGTISGTAIDGAWCVLTRGPEPLDPASFDVRRSVGPAGDELLARLADDAPSRWRLPRWRRGA